MGNSQSKKRIGPKTSPTFLYALWRSIILWNHTPLVDYVEGEWEAVQTVFKKAPGLLFVSVVVFVGFGTLVGYHYKSHRIGPIEGAYQEQKNTIAGLTQQLKEDKKDSEQKINQLTLERDHAKSDLGTWMLLGQSQITNTPLTQRCDMLLAQLEGLNSITNNDRPDFSILINGKSITNQETVILDSSRKLQITAKNISPVTAERTTIDLVIPYFASTNLTHDGWYDQAPPALPTVDGEMQLEQSTHIRIVAQDLVAGGGNGYLPHVLTISTNLSSGSSLCFIMVYATKSKLKRCDFALKY